MSSYIPSAKTHSDDCSFFFNKEPVVQNFFYGSCSVDLELIEKLGNLACTYAMTLCRVSSLYRFPQLKTPLYYTVLYNMSNISNLHHNKKPLCCTVLLFTTHKKKIKSLIPSI